MKQLFKRLLAALMILSILAGTAWAAPADTLHETAAPEDVAQVVDCAEGYAVVQNGSGAYGVVNAAGRYVVEYGVYPWIGPFSEGLALVKSGGAANWHWAYIDTTGAEVLSAAAWDEAGAFHDGLARVGKAQWNGSMAYGFINTAGELALDCSDYFDVGEFSDGYARVGTSSGDTVTYGFIDTNGSTIIGNLIDATDFSGGYALVKLYNKLSRKDVTCLIDTNGVPTVDLSQYSNLSPVSDSLLLVSPQKGSLQDGYGYMDDTGEVVIDCAGCEFVYPFSDGLALTEYLDGSGYLCYAYRDTDGDVAIDLGQCDLAVSYSDGYAIYQDGSSWFVMDTRGRVTFSSRLYESLDSYADGVLVACRASGAGRVYDLLTADGTVLAYELPYDYIDAFSDGLALAYAQDVQTGINHYYFIDAAGQVCLDLSDYDSVSSFSEGLLLASSYEMQDHYISGFQNWFLDKGGNRVLDCSDYSFVGSFSDDLVLVTGNDPRTLEEICFFLDSAGNVVLDCSEYDTVTPFSDGVSIVSRHTADGTVQHALMDTDGWLMTDWLDYNTVSGYAEGYAVVNYTSTLGAVDQAFYMNTDGSTALRGLHYDEYGDFHDGVAIVGSRSGSGMLYGCIDKTGAELIPLEYSRIFPFSCGVTWACRDGRWYCLTSSVPAAEPEPMPQQPTASITLTDAPIPFTDVTENDWFYGAVTLAYQTGMMNGITATQFQPDSTVTRAQAITMAVRAYCAWRGLPEVVMSTTEPWYQSYVNYAVTAGIMTASDFASYDTNASRAELAYLFSHVLPDADYPAINDVSTISDVPTSYRYHDEILAMYRAGVLTGYTDGSFQPDSYVKRSEVAAIITRVILPGQRKTV